jgi:predicted regulator of Ras-like GTPase activity (Roadblock/LC7/MglB family)
MSEEIKDVLNGILSRVRGSVAVILIDSDGIPIEVSGECSLPPEDLGALLSACYASYLEVGKDLGQEISSIMVEYNNLKLYQMSMPRGGLIIIADTSAYLGMIRLEGQQAIGKLSSMMTQTEEERQELMVKHKFRAPSDDAIKDILSRFG